MSEVIVRMDKFPTKCIDCKMWSICEALNKAMSGDQDWSASYLFHKTKNGFTKPADCPIVCVLPEQHGDLIDRDVALNDLEQFVCDRCRLRKKDDCLWCTAYAVKGVLIEVEPIIAATERSET